MTRILEIAWHLVIEEQKSRNLELYTPQQSAASVSVAALWTRESPTPLLVASSLSLCMLSFTMCGRHVFWLLFRDEISQCNLANLGPVWPQAHSTLLAPASQC